MSARYLAWGLLLLLGCQQPKQLQTAAPTPPPTLGIALPPVKTVALTIRPPDLSIDINLLELDGFYPPGVLRIPGEAKLPTILLPVVTTRFPSAEPLWSPDATIALYTDGIVRNTGGRKFVRQRAAKDIFHWLMFLRKGSEYPASLYCTATAFDLAWAPDGSRFALTDYVGSNASEIHIFSPAPARGKIDLSTIMRERFPSNAWDVPLFVKAYRWTDEGKLVVRGLGRSTAKPYELFGCEVLVDSSTVEFPLVRFLRGYIKE